MTTVFPCRLLVVTALALAALITDLPACGQVSGSGTVGTGQSIRSAIVTPGATAGQPSHDWQHGPRRVVLLDQAHIDLPADYAYLDSAQARQLLHAMGNPNVDDVAGLISGTDADWLIVVRFEKSGYIRETDTRSLDFDALLEAVRNGTGPSNLQRRSQGSQELEILGWLEPPSYDPQLHRLHWGIAVRNLGEAGTDAAAINYNTYLLGRDGYFTLNLVTSLQQIDKNRSHASRLVSAFEFESGKRYTDHTGKNEPMASFGLSALVSNGIAGKKLAAALVQRSFFADNVMIALLALGGLLLAGLTGLAAWLYLRKRTPPAAPAADLPQASETE